MTASLDESPPWSRVVVHYDEIALKGGNRPFFEKLLRENVRVALRGLPLGEVRRLPGRIMVVLREPVDARDVHGRLSCVPGIANFAPVLRMPLEPDRLAAKVAERVAGMSGRSFGVRTRRSIKATVLTSDQLSAKVGQAVVERTGLPVDLKTPDIWVRVEVLAREFLVSVERYPGAGGLPVGVNGKVAVLLSGGIDSPVAAYRAMRRGARAVFVHFHSQPFTDEASQEKAIELVEILSRFQGRSRLYLVPLGEYQRRIVASAPASLRVLLYRRLMFRIGERIAREEGAQALVTGECLGQVASQTLENLAAVSAPSRLLVLRPLVGLDKREIVAEAERIGTYDTSVEPHADCCSFLMPSHPATRSSAEELDRAESAWPAEEWAVEACGAAQRLVVEARRAFDAGPGRERAIAR